MTIVQKVEPPPDPEIDLRQLHPKVSAVLALWVPWQQLSREVFGVVSLADVPQGLLVQLDLRVEHAYQHEGVPSILLPTIIASKDGEVIDTPSLPRTIREADEEKARGFYNPGRRGYYLSTCNVPAPSCKLSELYRITTSMRKQQVAAEFRRDPVTAVNRMIGETLLELDQGD